MLPPHPTESTRANTTIGMASRGKRLRFRAQTQVEPSNIKVHTSGIGPGGKVMSGTTPEVAGAVVPTVTLTVCVPLPLSCTDELDRLQVGAGATAGVMVQPRFTVPLNDPVGARARVNVAVCPALMVWEFW